MDTVEQELKDVMISIRPEWCEKIISGEKTVEVRKTEPRLKTPFKCYIYCTSARERVTAHGFSYYTDELFRTPSGEIKFGSAVETVMTSPIGGWNGDLIMNRKVIGEFLCDHIGAYPMQSASIKELSLLSCVGQNELIEYAGKNTLLYGWNISDLVIYDKPKPLSDFLHWNEWRYIYKRLVPFKRPPQSWCYVEGIRGEHGQE